MAELERITADEVKQATKRPLLLILDNVRSMHNVGSAFRTADAFGIAAISLCGYTPTPPHRDIRKTALGAEETVLWTHFTTTTEAIENAKRDGYTIVAAEQATGSTSLQEYNWDGNLALAIVVGNEVNGVGDEALQLADRCLEIPQYGAKHSLNVAVSTGIILWELIRNIPIR